MSRGLHPRRRATDFPEPSGLSAWPELAAAVVRHAPRAVEMRHLLHREPELSNREFVTSCRVAAWLRDCGLEVTEGIAHTGVVAVLRGGLPGPVVALRADMDALPVTEETELPFRSQARVNLGGEEVGISHACGHDVHTAVCLGVASVLADLRDRVPGTVKLIFQPAEEGPPLGEEGGAALMLREGVLDGPRPHAIFALHTLPDLEVGKIGYTIGPAWAAVDEFRITLRGVQAHGAKPELGIDPVVMAAEAVMALQTIRSRNLSPTEPAVLTVGVIRGGERFNIIPRQVLLEGTVRTYDDEVRDAIERRMSEVLEGVCNAHGGSFEMLYERRTPVTVNDQALAVRSLASLRHTVGAENLVQLPPSMGGEDFAHFAIGLPAFYFRLGSLRPGGTSGGFHTPTFQADDGAIPVGMRALASVALDYLSGAPAGPVGVPRSRA